jgi:hypothetical protein
MPKSYLKSAPPPNQPVKDWLNWTRTQFKVQLSENLSKIATAMGINRAGDVQYLYMPIIIPKAFGTANENASAAIIGNLSNAHSEPSLSTRIQVTWALPLLLKLYQVFLKKYALKRLWWTIF